jgi:hypothetical protein
VTIIFSSLTSNLGHFSSNMTSATYGSPRSDSNLRLYAIDVTSAIVSAFAVAPFIAIIDQGHDLH